MTTWNKQTYMFNSGTKIRRIVNVRRTKYQELWRIVCKLLRFLLRRRFCRQNWYYMMLNFTPLPFPEMFYNHTSRSQKLKEKSWGGTRMRASKRTLQASVLSVNCLQTNEKPRHKMHNHLVVVRLTVAQSSFHAEFLSSIRFSPLRLLRRQKPTIFSSVFVCTWRRAKAKLVNNKS